MKVKRKLPSPITILMIVIIIAALATVLIPAGQYNRLSYSEGNSFTYTTKDSTLSLPLTQQTLDSLHIRISLEKFKSGAIRKPVSVPGTYQPMPENRQGFIQVLQAPIKGIYESVDIVFFILVIGGFMHVFNESGAMVKGLTALSYTMKGREAWLIIILTFLFSFAGSSYGMAEEALVFYPVMVPLFLAAGYDLLVPVAVIYAGTNLGTLSSFSNPFSTIIASNAAGVNWSDGLYERIIIFIITTIVTIWYIVRYANKVKANPEASLVYRTDGAVVSPYPHIDTAHAAETKLDLKTKLLLWLFLFTFLGMVGGVIMLDWWLLEMTTLFLGSSVLLAVILKLKETDFIRQFITGAESLLSVAMIVGVARGVTIILNEGHISDSILYYSANLAGSMPPVLFIVMLLALYMVFTLFIASSSGMAVLTMPIMGALAVLVNVPGREIVNAYLFGMGLMGFITPTGLILPSLALVNVSLKAWWRFIYPLIIILFIICAISLSIGIFYK
ncbi:MAG: YfcC family protein [Ferruginibacter sp.]|nr:YfcC family protein [Ferruginibacter sp.]